jgi:hypothetical protein
VNPAEQFVEPLVEVLSDQRPNAQPDEQQQHALEEFDRDDRVKRRRALRVFAGGCFHAAMSVSRSAVPSGVRRVRLLSTLM